MALIKCPECGKEISSLAISCPNCGIPLKEKEVGPVLIYFPAVSSLFAKGVVHCDGNEYICKKGETLSLDIKKPTTIDVKFTSFLGNPSLRINPGDRIVVSLNRAGTISLAKVDIITGNDTTYNW